MKRIHQIILDQEFGLAFIFGLDDHLYFHGSANSSIPIIANCQHLLPHGSTSIPIPLYVYAPNAMQSNDDVLRLFSTGYSDAMGLARDFEIFEGFWVDVDCWAGERDAREIKRRESEVRWTEEELKRVIEDALHVTNVEEFRKNATFSPREFGAGGFFPPRNRHIRHGPTMEGKNQIHTTQSDGSTIEAPTSTGPLASISASGSASATAVPTTGSPALATVAGASSAGAGTGDIGVANKEIVFIAASLLPSETAPTTTPTPTPSAVSSTAVSSTSTFTNAAPTESNKETGGPSTSADAAALKNTRTHRTNKKKRKEKASSAPLTSERTEIEGSMDRLSPALTEQSVGPSRTSNTPKPSPKPSTNVSGTPSSPPPSQQKKGQPKPAPQQKAEQQPAAQPQLKTQAVQQPTQKQSPPSSLSPSKPSPTPVDHWELKLSYAGAVKPHVGKAAQSPIARAVESPHGNRSTDDRNQPAVSKDVADPTADNVAAVMIENHLTEENQKMDGLKLKGNQQQQQLKTSQQQLESSQPALADSSNKLAGSQPRLSKANDASTVNLGKSQNTLPGSVSGSMSNIPSAVSHARDAAKEKVQWAAHHAARTVTESRPQLSETQKPANQQNPTRAPSKPAVTSAASSLTSSPAPSVPPTPAPSSDEDAPQREVEMPPTPEKSFNQEQAVVMPARLSTSSLGVRFGSLGLGGKEEVETTAPEPVSPIAEPAYGEEQQPLGPVSGPLASAQQSASQQPKQQQTLPEQPVALAFTQPGGALAHTARLPGSVPPYATQSATAPSPTSPTTLSFPTDTPTTTPEPENTTRPVSSIPKPNRLKLAKGLEWVIREGKVEAVEAEVRELDPKVGEMSTNVTQNINGLVVEKTLRKEVDRKSETPRGGKMETPLGSGSQREDSKMRLRSAGKNAVGRGSAPVDERVLQIRKLLGLSAQNAVAEQARLGSGTG
ncbi:hypothetical protein HK097_003525, partial [Rhizophlyctis rosea]